MTLATGKINIKRLPFWKAMPQTIEVVSGIERVLAWTAFTNKKDSVASVWELENLPAWATKEDGGIRVDPASGLIASAEFIARYTYRDILFRNTITLRVVHGDLVWTDQYGRVWVDTNRQTWGGRTSS